MTKGEKANDKQPVFTSLTGFNNLRTKLVGANVPTQCMKHKDFHTKALSL